MTKPFKEISEYIQTHLTGCQFVGISKDKEVLIEFDHGVTLGYDVAEVEKGAALQIKEEFPYVSKVIVVVKPPIEEATQLMEGLNKFLKDRAAQTEDFLEIKGLE